MVVSAEPSIQELRAFAEELVREAGQHALAYYGQGDVDTKFDVNLVTRAELELTEYLETRLQERFPHHRIFKGTPTEPDSEYTHDASRYMWIYDPLDGVANFQAGIPIWGGSLALLENFWPVLGVFFMPATGDLFHARAGDQAFWRQTPIAISHQPTINDESVLLTYSRFHRHYQTSFPGKIRNLGCTAAHICYVAMGRAEAAFIHNESYRNLATVQVIVEAAGGKIYKMDGREFFFNEYLDGNVSDERLVVVAPDKYDQVRRFLTEIAPDGTCT